MVVPFFEDTSESSLAKRKLRPKSHAESLKDALIGKPLDRLSTSKLPINRLMF